MKIQALAIAAFFASLTMAAGAKPLPQPEEVVLPSERPLLRRLLAALDTARPAEATKALDDLLKELPRPTPLRGLVQFYRGIALSEERRFGEADEALTESVRLLPEYSLPLLASSQTHAYQDRPAQAVDLLLRASRIDAEIVNELDDYEMWNLFVRLGEANDTRRQMALSERLFAVGWNRGRSSTESTMAMFVLEQRLERRDVEGAPKMVPRIVSPYVFQRLLTEKQFEPLRPAAETWAGTKLEKQWPIYLREARDEWEASKDPEAGRIYAGALAAAGHDKTLVSTFSSLFAGKIDADEEALVFIVPQLATALARLGRWDEADGLFAKALLIWHPQKYPNGLNLSANRAKLAFFKGDFAAAIKLMDLALEDSKIWGGGVNSGAVTSMHVYRACALEQLGRGGQDISSERAVTLRRRINPSSFAYFQLCKNNSAEAKKALLEGLEQEDTRSHVLAWMQPSDDRTLDSEFARAHAARIRQLQSDRQLIAAARKYGRILDWPVNSAAPAEQPVLSE